MLMRFRIGGCILFWGVISSFSLASQAVAQESYLLTEDYTDSREFSVTTKLNVTGKTQAAKSKDKATALKLNVDATLEYVERRLPPAGRDALALRCLRDYSDAHAEIRVGGQTTLPRLREKNRLIVAEGQPGGLRFYNPLRPMYFSELELLKAPGDSLAAIAMLPGRRVEIGETWTLDNWATQFVTSLEAIEKGEIQCTAKSIEKSQLKVEFAGEVTGANYGAFTTVKLSGDYTFDVKQGFVTRLVMKQSEKGSIGVVSQGLDVAAQVTMERSLKSSENRLTEEMLKKIPLEPEPAKLLIAFDSNAWNVRFHHSRLWHLYKHERNVAVLRLVDQGSLVAQCNVAPLKAAKPGAHMSEEQFLKDIQKTLGERFRGVNSAERIRGEAVGGDDGLFVHRVETFGQSNGVDAIWIHYLIAAPDGRQMALIFTVGKNELEKFSGRDIEIAAGLEFLEDKPQQAVGVPNKRPN